MSCEPALLITLVILNAEKQLLVEDRMGAFKLLEVRIPPFTRTVYEATVAAREAFGLKIFVILTAVPTPNANSPKQAGRLLICRLQEPDAALPANLQWLTHESKRLTCEDQPAIDAALDEFALYDSGIKASSFGRYSSLDELRAWYAPSLANLGVREKGIQQWNADPWFALFRISVCPLDPQSQLTPLAFWFKAVGEPNTRELPVTVALSRDCPNIVPRIIVTKPEVHGWLMEDVAGQELDDAIDQQSWTSTAHTLGNLQTQFVGREEDLLSVGCRDWRVPRVLSELDVFFEDMVEIMQRQTNETLPKLNRAELHELKLLCRDLCRRVEDADIPDSLSHGDFSPHNVIISRGMPVLIDWAEAYLSFPFISWEYLANRMIINHRERISWRRPMREAYAYRVWAPLLSAQRVNAGLRLSPAMAVLIAALYGIENPEQRRNLSADKYKRSLVRRLERELKALTECDGKD